MDVSIRPDCKVGCIYRGRCVHLLPGERAAAGGVPERVETRAQCGRGRNWRDSHSYMRVDSCHCARRSAGDAGSDFPGDAGGVGDCLAARAGSGTVPSDMGCSRLATLSRSRAPDGGVADPQAGDPARRLADSLAVSTSGGGWALWRLDEDLRAGNVAGLHVWRVDDAVALVGL